MYVVLQEPVNLPKLLRTGSRKISPSNSVMDHVEAIVLTDVLGHFSHPNPGRRAVMTARAWKLPCKQKKLLNKMMILHSLVHSRVQVSTFIL